MSNMIVRRHFQLSLPCHSKTEQWRLSGYCSTEINPPMMLLSCLFASKPDGNGLTPSDWSSSVLFGSKQNPAVMDNFDTHHLVRTRTHDRVQVKPGMRVHTSTDEAKAEAKVGCSLSSQFQHQQTTQQAQATATMAFNKSSVSVAVLTIVSFLVSTIFVAPVHACTGGTRRWKEYYCKCGNDSKEFSRQQNEGCYNICYNNYRHVVASKSIGLCCCSTSGLILDVSFLTPIGPVRACFQWV